MKRHTLTLLFIACLVFNSGNAQEYVFELLTKEDGLTQNTVNCILQDSKGYMWFGTDEGLSRYDGIDFENFQVDLTNPKKGLSSNLISALSEDEDHNIWISTAGNGVDLFDYKTERIVKMTSDEGPVPNMPYREVLQVFDGEYWLRADNKIYLLDSAKRPMKVNGKHYIDFEDRKITDALKINSKQVAVSTKRGVFIVEKESNNKYSVRIVAGTHELFVHGLNKYKEGFLVSTHYLGFVGPDLKLQKLSEHGGLDFLFTRNGDLWQLTRSTLIRLSNSGPESFDIAAFKKVLGKEIAFDKLFLYEDSNQIIWVGTPGAGVVKVSIKENKFDLIKQNLLSPNVKENIIRSVLEDSKGNLWIGTDGGGISFASKNGESIESFIDLDNSATRGDFVKTLHETKMGGKDYIFVGTNYPVSHRTYSYNEGEIIESPLPGKMQEIKYYITCFESDNNYIWVGTYAFGLYRYHKKTGQLDKFLPDNEHGISSSIIRGLFIDSKKRLWIGTDAGLNMLSQKQQTKTKPTFKVFQRKENDLKSLSHNYVIPITETKDNRILVGTFGGGLNIYDEETESFKWVYSKHGLANNTIQGILEDELGDIWVSTNHGISKIQLSELEVTNYSPSDGLNGFEFSALAAIKCKNGQFIFGGSGGLNAFYPSETSEETGFANVVFKSLQLLNQTVHPDEKFNGRTLLKKNIDETHQLSLNHNENSFSISFTALDFSSPTEIRYRYKLEGHDNTWIETGANARFAKYTNIDQGQYVFKVQSTNSRGTWNDNYRSLQIVVNPPWWKTTIAYLAYGLLFIISLFLSRKYALIQIEKKKSLEMERFEKQKIEEVSKLKLDIFTNLSHEFRTPLTIIMGYMDKLLKSTKPLPETERNYYIGHIERNSNSLLRLTRQLSDFRKYEQGKLELAVTENDIVSFVKDSFESFRLIALKKNISYNFSTDIKTCLAYFDQDKIEKVLYNLLSNALKFTPEHGKVKVQCQQNENEVIIKISDSGIGIAAEKQEHIFDLFFRGNKLKNMGTGIGLSFAKSMIDLHHGKLECVSQPDKGTIFSVKLLKGSDHFSDNDFSNSSDHESIFNLTENMEWSNPLAGFDYIPESEIDGANKDLVLIVEDNPEIREYLKISLFKYYRIEEAADGKKGVEKAKELNPDLIISDIVMPEMDGKQLCEVLKQTPDTSHIPIVLLTAYSSDKQQIEGLQLGADDYITKPFKMEIVLSRIKNLLANRKLLKDRFSTEIFVEPKDLGLSSYDQQLLEKTIYLINSNIENESLDVAFLANELAMSRMQLYRKINGITDMSPSELIRTTKLKTCARLLATQKHRVSEVMMMTGYTNRSTFNKAFKKQFGISPTDYQEEKNTI